MAMQIKYNPVYNNRDKQFVGKTLTAFQIVTGANLSDELGANGAFQLILRFVAEYATPVIISEIATIGTNATFQVFVEGDFTERNDFLGPVSGNRVSYAMYLQEQLQNLGTNVAPRAVTEFGEGEVPGTVLTSETVSTGVDLSSATVNTPTVYYFVAG